MKIERTIDRESKLKLYVQIYSIIRDKIESGEWPLGIQIPTEDELCKTYDVSKVTVRDAVEELVREGYLKRLQGKGTFVTYSIPQLGLMMRTRLSDCLYGEGVTVNKKILERDFRKPPEEIKKILMTDDEINYILCKNHINGILLIEESFVPVFELPDIDDEDLLYKQFLDLIVEKGTKKISRIIQIFEITALKGETAYQLEVKEGSPGLVVNRIVMSSDGNPIAYVRYIGSGNNKMQMEFERIK
jgi:DNA-binding GntR family transcriptional regulator